MRFAVRNTHPDRPGRAPTRREVRLDEDGAPFRHLFGAMPHWKDRCSFGTASPRALAETAEAGKQSKKQLLDILNAI